MPINNLSIFAIKFYLGIKDKAFSHFIPTMRNLVLLFNNLKGYSYCTHLFLDCLPLEVVSILPIYLIDVLYTCGNFYDMITWCMYSFIYYISYNFISIPQSVWSPPANIRLLSIPLVLSFSVTSTGFDYFKSSRRFNENDPYLLAVSTHVQSSSTSSIY